MTRRDADSTRCRNGDFAWTLFLEISETRLLAIRLGFVRLCFLNPAECHQVDRFPWCAKNRERGQDDKRDGDGDDGGRGSFAFFG